MPGRLHAPAPCPAWNAPRARAASGNRRYAAASDKLEASAAPKPPDRRLPTHEEAASSPTLGRPRGPYGMDLAPSGLPRHALGPGSQARQGRVQRLAVGVIIPSTVNPGEVILSSRSWQQIEELYHSACEHRSEER